MDTAENKAISANLANCLGCDGLVRIPSNANVNATVRCPHCSCVFHLHQIIDQSIPELLIVHSGFPDRDVEIIPVIDRVLDQNSENEGDPKEKFVVPPQLAAGAKRKRRHRKRSKSRSEHRGPFSANRKTQATSVSSPGNSKKGSRAERTGPQPIRRPLPSKTTTPSSSRPKTSRTSGANPTVEFLKILLGGALAFPIAYSMIFWIFGQDPLNLGPPVATVAPWAVPADLQGNTVQTEQPQSHSLHNGKNASSNSDEKKSLSEFEGVPLPDADSLPLPPDTDTLKPGSDLDALIDGELPD